MLFEISEAPMNIDKSENQDGWNEALSRQFIDYGRYFVPEREHQMHVMARLLTDLEPNASIMELCCGEGLLSEVLLEYLPTCTIQAYDGSQIMLTRAQQRLAHFGDRFQCQIFELASPSWRTVEYPAHAAVSSLAIHHLPGPQKQELFRDILRMLLPGGVFVIADVVEVIGTAGKGVAAEEWDNAVRMRSYELDGNNNAFDFFLKEGWNMHRYLDPNDIDKPSPLFDQLKWLEMAGFIEIDVHWLLAGHAIFSARKSSDQEKS
jgi:tRNA (cmo5U34)-methyltransferase